MHQIRSESETAEVLSCEGWLACRIDSHVIDSQRTDSMTLETYGLNFGFLLRYNDPSER